MKISELFEAALAEGYAIKLNDGKWYSEQQPTLGPLKGGNAQVRTFKTMDAADDFLIKQQNSKFGGRKFEDAEIKQYRASKVKEGYDTSEKNREPYDDIAEWKKAVRQAGADYDQRTPNKLVATGYDGTCGEFDTKAGEGWLIEKWAKKVGEAAAGKGMWVIKNKDGAEKRFKDDESPAAKAWAASSSPKKSPAVKAVKYSQEWWEAKEDAAERYGDVLTPWSHIDLGMGNGELSTEALEEMGEDQGFGNVDDFHELGGGETTVDGVVCATIRLRVVVVYTKDDDLGIEGDEPVSDAYTIMVRRDTKDPSKFVFMRFM